MNPEELVDLERIEYDACTDWYRAAPAAIVEAYGIEVTDVAGASCLGCRHIEPAMIFRRAFGVGVGRSARESELDALLAYIRSRGECYAVPVAPAAQPADLPRWLEARGFERGYAWMKFSRSLDARPDSATDLLVRTVDAEDGIAFGEIVTQVFKLPSSIVPWLASLPGRPGWICTMAFDGRRPVAAGAAFVRGDYAWLGLGGTLASHRRHGAQNALIAHRLQEAASRGASLAVTETGERLPDLPSNSYRNILRAGFEERYLRQNYESPAAD
jgi:GNAT superfamily N-acetyltransferase